MIAKKQNIHKKLNIFVLIINNRINSIHYSLFMMDKIISRPIPDAGICCRRCDEGQCKFLTILQQDANCNDCPFCGYWGGQRIPYYYSVNNKARTCCDNCRLKTANANYCINCRILYNEGCIHAENGCSDDIYHAQLVYSYQCNSQKYEGMPVFESAEHCCAVLPNLKLNWFCTCNNNQYDCEEAGYPREVEHECKNYEKK